MLGSLNTMLRKRSDWEFKKTATLTLKIPRRATEIGANDGSAAASINHRAASSTKPEVIKLYLTGKRLQIGKFVISRNYLFFKKFMDAIQWAPKLFPSATLGCDVSFGLIEKQFVPQNYIQYKKSQRKKDYSKDEEKKTKNWLKKV